MLKLIIKGEEYWDEVAEEFTAPFETILELEHSLVSLSKWESKFETAFLGAGDKTAAQILTYIECMILTADFAPEVLLKLSQQNIDEVNTYINAPQTATWFASDPGGRKSGEVITSELIYYWMIAFTIPFECQHWHLNRLFTLIRVCNIKNSKPKKQTRAEMIAHRAQLNAQRRAQTGSSG